MKIPYQITTINVCRTLTMTIFASMEFGMRPPQFATVFQASFCLQKNISALQAWQQPQHLLWRLSTIDVTWFAQMVTATSQMALISVFVLWVFHISCPRSLYMYVLIFFLEWLERIPLQSVGLQWSWYSSQSIWSVLLSVWCCMDR